MRKKITFLSALLVAALLLGMVPFGAFRTEAYAATTEPVADENPLDVEGDKTASPTKLDPDNRETEVTLSLPSAEYKNKIAVMFVMDDSDSVANAGLDFSVEAGDMLDSVLEKNPGIEIKVGVVKYKGYAKAAFDGKLTLYTAETKQSIKDAIKSTSLLSGQHGSNGHSGLILANQILAQEKEIDDNNKYLIFLTDGKNYIWNNSDNEPVTYYAQVVRMKGMTYKVPSISQIIGYNRELGSNYWDYTIGDYSTYMIRDAEGNIVANDYDSPTYYEALYNDTNAELVGEDTTYVFPAYYSGYYSDDTPISAGGFVSNEDGYPVTNGSIVGGTNDAYIKYYDYTPEGEIWEALHTRDDSGNIIRHYYVNTPYEVIKNSDGTYSFDSNRPNKDFFLWHPDSMQKGTYEVGHYWASEIAPKYHTGVVAIYPTASGSGTHIVGSFNEWLVDHSDFGVSARTNTKKDPLTQKDKERVAQLFDDIDNSIRYLIGSGIVEDKITDVFTLVEDGNNTFTMNLTETIDGKEVVTPIACKESEVAKYHWVFGEANEEGVYPYTVSYDKDTKTITWGINVDVENAKRISLSYKLEIAEDADNDDYDTNVSAILDYVSTDKKYEGQYTFPIPTVEYESMAPYVIRHLDEDTGNPIADDVTRSAVIGSYVSGSAVTVTGYKFSRVEPEEGGIPITKVAADNVITFFYKVVEGNYLILHIDQDSDEVIREGSGKGQVGKYVTGAAITLDGYLVDLKDERTVSYLETLDEDESKNVMKFYYAPIYYELTYYSNYPNGESPKSATYSYRFKELPPEVKSPDDVEDPENGVFSVGKKWTSADGTEYDFTGWNTKPDGTGTSYQSPEKYQFNLNEDANPTNNNDNTDNNNQQGDAAGNATVTTSSLRTGLVMAASSSSIGATGALYGQWKPVPTPPGGNGSGSPTKYTVTYKYTGDVPSGAPAVPATKTYEAGDSVPAASEPSMEGYTFSGWSGEVSTMPKHDVTVTGSWTADEPIDDPDTPLAPPTDDETDIDDPDTPLAPGTIDEETEIDDEETPLSPFTGDNRHTGLWAGISIASLAGIALLSKRRRKPAKH